MCWGFTLWPAPKDKSPTHSIKKRPALDLIQSRALFVSDSFSARDEPCLVSHPSLTHHSLYNRGAITNATTDMSLSRMLSEGPEVSLKGSPTVSPTTAALCGSDPL